MGKDSRVYSDRRSRSSGSNASRDRTQNRRYSPSPETRIITTNVESGLPIEIPPGAVATTKHEEWTTKKKVQHVVTKEVETRVQRQLVTEDGRVVEDSGPQITQQTREEKKINEEEDTQHKTPNNEPMLEGYVAIPGATVINTKTESKVKSHEVKEDHKETHDEHIEDISGEEFHRRALMGRDERDSTALIRRSGTPSSNYSSSGPRIVNQYTKRHKVTDRDDIQEVSREKDGAVTTERTITHQTEEEADDEVPEEDDNDRNENVKMIEYQPENSRKEHRIYVHKENEHEDRKEKYRHRDRTERSSERAYREGYKEENRHHSHHRKREEYEEDDSRRHSKSRHREKRSPSPVSRRHDRSVERSDTMRSNASSHTKTPKSQYYMGDYDYDDDQSHRSERREKKAQDDFSSVRRHESFHHEARSHYTPHSNRSNVHRTNSQRSVGTVTDDNDDYYEPKYSSLNVKRERRNRSRGRDSRSPSPVSNRSPSQKYYLGEDPWQKNVHSEERGSSRSHDLRKDALTRSHERNRHEDHGNRKDLYAWEDHRSRDSYSHSTKLDDDYYSERERHGSGSKLSDRENRIRSYSPDLDQDYGPKYAVSAHTRSEDFENDPNDPHRKVHRTTSQSQSEDVKTVPIHDGGKKVTVSKVRQKHYRSEMKYDDGSMADSPPASPPLALHNSFDFDEVDSRRYQHTRDFKSMRNSQENVSSLDRREYRFDGGYDDSHKSPNERQRYVAKEVTRSPSPPTVHITPDYLSESRFRSQSPKDPVLELPTFTPLRSPLSVKTADETTTNNYNLKSSYQKNDDQKFEKQDYTTDRYSSSFQSPFSLRTADDTKSNSYSQQSSFQKKEYGEKDDHRYKSHDYTTESSKNDDYSSLQDYSNSKYKSSSKLSNDRSYGTDKYISKIDMKSLGKEDISGEKENLLEEQYEKQSYYPNQESGITKLKKLDTFPTLSKTTKVDIQPKKLSPEPIRKYNFGQMSPKNESKEQYTYKRKEEPKEQYMFKYNEGTNEKYSFKKREDPKEQYAYKPKEELKEQYAYKKKEQPKEQFTYKQQEEPLIIPEPPEFRDEKDNESIKSDKSRTSTRTFTLEDSNTNSLKKIHLNTTFKKEAAKPVGKSKKPVKTINEEIAPEPMKQIIKTQPPKKAPVTVPPRPARSLVKATSHDGTKTGSVKAQKAPLPPARKNRGKDSAKSQKKPLVEVRGWDSR